MRRRAKQIIELAARYLPGIRRRARRPDVLTEIAIERMQARLDEVHSLGRRYLPEAPSSTADSLDTALVTEPVRIRRNDHGAAL